MRKLKKSSVFPMHHKTGMRINIDTRERMRTKNKISGVLPREEIIWNMHHAHELDIISCLESAQTLRTVNVHQLDHQTEHISQRTVLKDQDPDRVDFVFSMMLDCISDAAVIITSMPSLSFSNSQSPTMRALAYQVVLERNVEYQ